MFGNRFYARFFGDRYFPAGNDPAPPVVSTNRSTTGFMSNMGMMMNRRA